MREGRIAVAMSGGVDSSVAALLLHGQGKDLLGLSLQILPGGKSDRAGVEACGSSRHLHDARLVAEQLGFPLHVLDMEKEFRRLVLAYFVSEYRAGRTPLPCALCNSGIKFGELMRHAEGLGCVQVATGHYARLRRDPATGRTRLLRGKDREKDQSYFLFQVTPQQMDGLLFPVGDLTKGEVRRLALEAGLPVADKPESMDICFLSGEGYRGLLQRELQEAAPKPGEFVDRAGRVLGTHGGVHLFTVGQRRGLGLCGEEAWYVLEIRSESRQVVLGREKEQYRSTCSVPRTNWIGADPPRRTLEATVQIRYRHRGCEAAIEPDGEGAVRIRFRHPQRAITPGQAAVFYRDDEVLGGGFIGCAH